MKQCAKTERSADLIRLIGFLICVESLCGFHKKEGVYLVNVTDIISMGLPP